MRSITERLFSTDILGGPYNFHKISMINLTILPFLTSNSYKFLTIYNCCRITDNFITK